MGQSLFSPCESRGEWRIDFGLSRVVAWWSMLRWRVVVCAAALDDLERLLPLSMGTNIIAPVGAITVGATTETVGPPGTE